MSSTQISVKMVVRANERHNKHFGFSWGFQAPATLVSSSYLKMNGDTKRFPALKRSSMHCIDFGSLTLQLIQTVLQFSAPNVHILFRVTPKKVSRFFSYPFKRFCIVNHKVFSKEWQKKCPCTHHFYPQASTFQKSFFSVWKITYFGKWFFCIHFDTYWSDDCPYFVACPFKAKIGLEIDYLKDPF